MQKEEGGLTLERRRSSKGRKMRRTKMKIVNEWKPLMMMPAPISKCDQPKKIGSASNNSHLTSRPFPIREKLSVIMNHTHKRTKLAFRTPITQPNQSISNSSSQIPYGLPFPFPSPIPILIPPAPSPSITKIRFSKSISPVLLNNHHPRFPLNSSLDSSSQPETFSRFLFFSFISDSLR